MIAMISGKVLEKEDKALIIDVGGIGYRVSVLESLNIRAKIGGEVRLLTHHHITAESQGLFGFENKEHLKYFNLLLTVPSVGARTAMGILEVAKPATLAQAVHDDDVKLLTKVSGVGKKTAQRILIELRGKIDVKERTQAGGELQEEVIEALMSIGYKANDARKVVAALPVEVETVEDAVRLALREKEKV